MDESRRSFLSLLGLSPLAFPSGLAGERRSLSFVLDQFKVAGFQYYEGPSLLAQMRAGGALLLADEPENTFDEHAVRIECHGRQIGYVPRERNTVIFNLLQQSAAVFGQIETVNPAAEPWNAVELRALLTI